MVQGRRLLVALAEELASAPWLPTPASTGRDRERGTRAQGILGYVERLERASGPAQRSDGLQGAKEQHSCVFHSPVYVSTSTTLLKLRHRALSDGGGVTAESGSHFFLAQTSCVIWGSLMCLSGLSFGQVTNSSH